MIYVWLDSTRFWTLLAYSLDRFLVENTAVFGVEACLRSYNRKPLVLSYLLLKMSEKVLKQGDIQVMS